MLGKSNSPAIKAPHLPSLESFWAKKAPILNKSGQWNQRSSWANSTDSAHFGACASVFKKGGHAVWLEEEQNSTHHLQRAVWHSA